MSTDNQAAWNQDTYNAWVERFGSPTEAAARLTADPYKSLGSLGPFLGPVQGKKILNLMGSHGSKAVGLALLGADVTVADFSEGNQRYALELAAAAGIPINYILTDIFKLDMSVHAAVYDVVLTEMGILHYFSELTSFMTLTASLLKPGGCFVLRDFHPVSTKLISYRGSTAKVRKYKLDGDYFSTETREHSVAYSKFSTQADTSPMVQLRSWTLGETVTAVAQAGLVIQNLTEEPNLSSEVFDKGIPKTFILQARKTSTVF